jgi:hypothetical protein
MEQNTLTEQASAIAASLVPLAKGLSTSIICRQKNTLEKGPRRI